MFDLTKEIRFDSSLQKKYSILRFFLFALFVLGAGFVLYRILFPIVPLDFSMNNPNSAKNSLVNPRSEESSKFPAKGIIAKQDKLIFNANPIGQFSDIKISFTAGKNSKSIEDGLVEIKKSYQAFFFPIGKPVGFPNGSLLTNPDNGSYYIISNGELRKFSNTDIILKLGYPKNAFANVSQEDLSFNPAGEEISSSDSYPDNSLFTIGDTNYELKNGQLFPFISTRAFLSKFNSASAIAKNADFFSKYPASETSLGFIDGTLASSGQSVFILSGTKRYPIENAVAFQDMGFSWDAVAQMTQDELGAYEQQKQFTHDQPHPDGTVFFDKATNKSFLIENGFKRPIPTDTIAKAYANSKAIVADSKSINEKTTCSLKKNIFASKSFTCTASLEKFESLEGNDFQITAYFPDGANLSTIETKFSTPLTVKSLKKSLSRIKEKTINR